MITLDTATLRFRALNMQGCYMVGIGNHRVKEILLGGKKNHRVFYCDVNSGFAIVHKENLDGALWLRIMKLFTIFSLARLR